LFVSRANSKPADGLAFGRLLGIALKAEGLSYTRHHLEDVAGEWRKLLDPDAGVYRDDHLIVLTHTKMPAMLLLCAHEHAPARETSRSRFEWPSGKLWW
jgi:N-acetylmuramoyl-L-alanine amidase